VAGEMKNPFRDLPRVINSAMAIVLLGFVLMNASLYIVLPMDAIRDPKTVAVVGQALHSSIRLVC
jgi:solute carrier family 7 (L-type amino acid transporter), member 6